MLLLSAMMVLVSSIGRESRILYIFAVFATGTP